MGECLHGTDSGLLSGSGDGVRARGAHRPGEGQTDLQNQPGPVIQKAAQNRSRPWKPMERAMLSKMTAQMKFNLQPSGLAENPNAVWTTYKPTMAILIVPHDKMPALVCCCSHEQRGILTTLSHGLGTYHPAHPRSRTLRALTAAMRCRRGSGVRSRMRQYVLTKRLHMTDVGLSWSVLGAQTYLTARET